MSRINIRYTLFTADGCERSFLYRPTDSGRNFRVSDKSEWKPEEPCGHTTSATVDFTLAQGRRHEVELTGDQHRDLEDRDELNAWFVRVVDGEDPYDALDEVLARPGMAA